MGLTLNEWGLYKLSEYEPVSMPTGGKAKGKAAPGKASKKTGEAPAAKAVASKTEADVYRASACRSSSRNCARTAARSTRCWRASSPR